MSASSLGSASALVTATTLCVPITQRSGPDSDDLPAVALAFPSSIRMAVYLQVTCPTDDQQPTESLTLNVYNSGFIVTSTASSTASPQVPGSHDSSFAAVA